MSEPITAAEVGVITNASRPATSTGMTSRVARGTLWTIGGQCAVILVTLIATPFTIRLLGPEAYAILTLINVLIGYLAITDMGMGLAATRFAADAHARFDDQGEAAVVWTSALIALVPAALSALALALFAGTLVNDVLRLPTELRSESIVVLRLGALGFIARTASGVLSAPQLARLRMELNTLVTSGMAVVQSALILAVLLIGGGLTGAVSAIVAISLAGAFVHFSVSRALLPRLRRPRIDPALIKPLTRFGLGVVLSAVAATILINVEKVMLPRFASVTELAHYAVAFSVAGMLTLVPSAMMRSLLPAFSGLHSDGNCESLAALYGRALRGNLLWIAPASVILFVGAKPFFTLWAGAEFGEHSTVPFYILVAGLLFNTMAYVPYTLLLALGKSNLVARFHLAEVIPYFLCVVLLTLSYGAIGAALGYSLRLAVDALLLFIAKRYVVEFPDSRVPMRLHGYVAAIVLLSVPLMLAGLVRVNPFALAGITVLCLLAYAGVVWRRVLTAAERAWIIHAAPWNRGRVMGS